MNKILTETNRVWLEQNAKPFEVPPEALLNVILDRLRQKNLSAGECLHEWIDDSSKVEADLADSAAVVRKTATEVQSAARACRNYVSLIEANRVTK
jgi:hypothetical protein